MEEFHTFDPHLVLLDIALPFYNGFHWCTQIRRLSKVPILFLSSASDNMNIVMAMELGADDFIAKPFDMHVLVAKVQALLRRTYAFQGASAVVEHQGALVDLGAGSISYQGQKLPLTKNELCILQTLLEHKGQTVSRDALMQRLWDDESFVDDNTLTVNVTRLRKKLSEIGLNGWIITKKGVGYLIEG